MTSKEQILLKIDDAGGENSKNTVEQIPEPGLISLHLWHSFASLFIFSPPF
jgi:hypothetical protein